MSKGLSLFEKRRRRNRTTLRSRAGTRPRLHVHRSGKHIYAQIIDDEAEATVRPASSSMI
ncbi:MAG: 50S ribosomal protein L18, partial [Sphingomonas sp.]